MARTRSEPWAIRAIVPTIAITLAFAALLVWGELSSWQSQVHNVENETENLAMSLTQHADDTVELAAMPLLALVSELEFEGFGAQGLANIRNLIGHLKQETPRIKDLFVFDQSGAWIASTDTIPAGVNETDRDYFIFHSQSMSAAPRLGQPIVSRSSGVWVIPVSMRINHADGSFAGVALATIEARYFSDYYQSFQTGEHGAILLVHGDGTILSRAPFDERLMGTRVEETSEFRSHLKVSDSGAFHFISPIDGVERIGGYYRSWRSQLVVLAAVSQQEALANWMAGAKVRWVAILLLLVGVLLLSTRILDQNRRQAISDRRLARNEWEYRVLAESTGDMVCRLDPKGIRRYVSPASRTVVGIEPQDLVGTDAFALVHPDDVPLVRKAVERLRRGERDVSIEYRRAGAKNGEQWLESRLSRLPPSDDPALSGVVSVTRDVTERKRLQAMLAELASVDGLTGLANRRALDQRIEGELERARRTQAPLSFILIDVDRFKLYNDTYGHAAGDKCLKKVSQAIAGCARRPADFVARYGGEEIAVVLPDTDRAGAVTVAETMRQAVFALAIEHRHNTPWQCVTISLGITTSEDGVATPDDLIRAADQELYDAKSTGRNRTVTAPT